MGARMGITIKQICRKSRKNPSTKINSILINKNPHIPPGKLDIIIQYQAISPHPPEDQSESCSADQYHKDHAGQLCGFVALSRSDFSGSIFCAMAASISAPMAPTAADSVGEAIPKKIDPNTAKIRSRGGNKRSQYVSDNSVHPQVVLSAGGSGRSVPRIYEDIDHKQAYQHKARYHRAHKQATNRHTHNITQ